MTTVSGTNIREIPALIDTVVENHVDIFAFACYCPANGLANQAFEKTRASRLANTAIFLMFAGVSLKTAKTVTLHSI
ncbi:MAG: hypothetical protein Pg6C_05370 [Treponemataceae bacterium]|nr:MAG: hypothetical protein Pg6C_05370 [Treponemataceae bacterium]